MGEDKDEYNGEDVPEDEGDIFGEPDYGTDGKEWEELGSGEEVGDPALTSGDEDYEEDSLEYDSDEANGSADEGLGAGTGSTSGSTQQNYSEETDAPFYKRRKFLAGLGLTGAAAGGIAGIILYDGDDGRPVPAANATATPISNPTSTPGGGGSTETDTPDQKCFDYDLSDYRAEDSILNGIDAGHRKLIYESGILEEHLEGEYTLDTVFCEEGGVKASYVDSENGTLKFDEQKFVEDLEIREEDKQLFEGLEAGTDWFIKNVEDTERVGGDYGNLEAYADFLEVYDDTIDMELENTGKSADEVLFERIVEQGMEGVDAYWNILTADKMFGREGTENFLEGDLNRRNLAAPTSYSGWENVLKSTGHRNWDEADRENLEKYIENIMPLIADVFWDKYDGPQSVNEWGTIKGQMENWAPPKYLEPVGREEAFTHLFDLIDYVGDNYGALAEVTRKALKDDKHPEDVYSDFTRSMQRISILNRIRADYEGEFDFSIFQDTVPDNLRLGDNGEINGDVVKWFSRNIGSFSGEGILDSDTLVEEYQQAIPEATDTATETSTETATDTSTDSPTDTDSPTPTDSQTPTATDTATPTQTPGDGGGGRDGGGGVDSIAPYLASLAGGAKAAKKLFWGDEDEK